MPRRHAWALLRAVLGSLVVIALLYWWLTQSAPPAESAETEPAQAAASEAAAQPLEFPEVRLEMPPTPTPAEEQPLSGEEVALATRVEGEKESDSGADPQPAQETPPVETVPPEPVPQTPVPPPQAPPETVTPEPDPTEKPEPEPEKPEPEKPESEPAEPTPSPSVPEPKPALTPEPLANRAVQKRGQAEGTLPPLRYAGNTALLARKYPRIEVAWVTQQSPTAESEEARTILEAILDADGRVQWQRHQPQGQSAGFSFATMRYNTNGRVRVGDPTQLQLWQRRTEIARLAGVPVEEERRFLWGHYRHRAEVYELLRVQTAFQTHPTAGEVYDPASNSHLEVVWGENKQGEPEVLRAVLKQEGREEIELKLPVPD